MCILGESASVIVSALTKGLAHIRVTFESAASLRSRQTTRSASSPAVLTDDPSSMPSKPPMLPFLTYANELAESLPLLVIRDGVDREGMGGKAGACSSCLNPEEPCEVTDLPPIDRAEAVDCFRNPLVLGDEEMLA